MNFDFNNIVLALFFIASLTSGLSIYAWQRRHFGVWAVLFTSLMVGVSIWCLGYGLEIGVESRYWKIVWAKFQYIGIVFVPAS